MSKEKKDEIKGAPKVEKSIFDADPLGDVLEAVTDIVTGKIFDGPKIEVTEVKNDEAPRKEERNERRSENPIKVINQYFGHSKPKRRKSKPDSGTETKGTETGNEKPPEDDGEDE